MAPVGDPPRHARESNRVGAWLATTARNESLRFLRPTWSSLRGLAGRSDPVPDEAIRFVESLFSWRTLDAELAELSYDSVLDDEGAALARGPDQPRLLTFGGRSMTLEVEVVEVRGRRGLRGQLAPPQPAEIEARQRDGIQRARADEMGRFLIEGLAPGPVSLRCRAGSEREAVPTDTDWFLL